MIGYSLETRLADQEVTQQHMWLWSKKLSKLNKQPDNSTTNVVMVKKLSKLNNQQEVV